MNSVFRIFLVLSALLIASPALAQEPVGCDKFKWSVERERALLANPSHIASGGELLQPLATAVTVTLVPIAEAKLPFTPSSPPKSPDTNAGFIRVPTIPNAGTYRITVSHGAWIDAVQDGQELKAVAFSGVAGCDGIAKSVKFEMAAAPLLIQLSGTTASAVAIVVTPD
jgi:hypothetical protein